MALHRLVLDTTMDTTQTAATLALRSGSPLYNFRRIVDFLRTFIIGARRGNATWLTGAVQATGLVTFTGAPVADETLSIANVTFTAKASGATGNQFNIGASVTLTAASLASFINASSSLSGLVSATSALGVVTLTCVVPGVAGNGLQLTENMTNTAVTAFASGSNGTSTSMGLGKA